VGCPVRSLRSVRRRLQRHVDAHVGLRLRVRSDRATDTDVGLIDEPAITDTVTARPNRLDDQRSEPLHPPVDRDVIDPLSVRSGALQRRGRTGRSGGTSEQPTGSRPVGTESLQTTETQSGDSDEKSLRHATTRTRSVNATVPPREPQGAGEDRPVVTRRLGIGDVGVRASALAGAIGGALAEITSSTSRSCRK
jgi:hypothetical protein